MKIVKVEAMGDLAVDMAVLVEAEDEDMDIPDHEREGQVLAAQVMVVHDHKIGHDH